MLNVLKRFIFSSSYPFSLETGDLFRVCILCCTLENDWCAGFMSAEIRMLNSKEFIAIFWICSFYAGLRSLDFQHKYKMIKPIETILSYKIGFKIQLIVIATTSSHHKLPSLSVWYYSTIRSVRWTKFHNNGYNDCIREIIVIWIFGWNTAVSIFLAFEHEFPYQKNTELMSH